MMDSDIKLESEPGKGSSFSFSVKLQPVSGEKTTVTSQPEEISFPGKRILVVEDNELNMEIICTILENYGIETEQAVNGKEAVRQHGRIRSRILRYDLYGYYDAGNGRTGSYPEPSGIWIVRTAKKSRFMQ